MNKKYSIARIYPNVKKKILIIFITKIERKKKKKQACAAFFFAGQGLEKESYFIWQHGGRKKNCWFANPFSR